MKKYTGKKILVALAHPDDESFGMGGTLAYYAKHGAEIHLVCATRGEAGTIPAGMLVEGQSAAELREGELRCAAQILGLAQVDFLNHRDSGMVGSEDNRHPQAFVGVPLEKVTEAMVRKVRTFRPDIVITFDPVGGYHHPDHIHIQRATVAAFAAASDPTQFPGAGEAYSPAALYFSVFPRRLMRTMVHTLDWAYRRRWAHKIMGAFRKSISNPRQFGRNQDIDLVLLTGDEDYPEHVLVDYREVADAKDRADACHASQLDFGRQGGNRAMSLMRRLQRRRDRFMRAYPETPRNFRSRDLFSF